MTEQQDVPASFLRKQLLNFIGLVILVSLLLVLFFPGILFHDIIDARIIKALQKSEPTAEVIIVNSRYNLWQNSFRADEFRFQAKNIFNIQVNHFSVRRIKWLQIILRGRLSSGDIVRTSGDAKELNINLFWKGYNFSCRNFHLSVPAAGVSADSVIYRIAGSDEKFFARSNYRKTRINVKISKLLLKLPFIPEQWTGKTYRLQYILAENASVSLLVNKDKEFAPDKPKGIMPNEMLKKSAVNLQIDSFLITGNIDYGERFGVGLNPAVVTFNNSRIRGFRFGNMKTGDTCLVFAKSKMMDTAHLELNLHYPLFSDTFQMIMNGKMGAFDLSKLNRFVETAAHIRIKDGIHHKTTFHINFYNRIAKGIVTSYYENIKVALIDSVTREEKGSLGKLGTLLANIKLKGSNMPGTQDVKQGYVSYTRKKNDTFIRLIWRSLREGIGEIAGFGKKKKNKNKE